MKCIANNVMVGVKSKLGSLLFFSDLHAIGILLTKQLHVITSRLLHFCFSSAAVNHLLIQSCINL